MTVRNDITMFWELSPRIIQIDAPSTSISIQDLIDTCSHLCSQPANIDDDVLLESSGKEYLIEDGSVKVGLTVTLNNAKIAFEARPPSDWILCSIEGGNAVAVEDIYATPRVYFDVRKPTAYTSVDRVSASSATLSDLSAIQYASFGGGVTIDVINGAAGVAFPIGTIETPSNNIVDGAAIANERGFHTFFIKGDVTLSNTVNLANYTIKGESIIKSKITIEPVALVSGTEFVDATINGTLDGDNTAHHCAIQTLNYVHGHIHDCLLEEYTIILGGSEDTTFLDCWSAGADQSTVPVIDMGGSGKKLTIRGHSGGIKLINKSGPEDAVLDFESGRVLIDSTITAGNVTIRGVGQVTDNSTGTTVVNTDGVISQTTIADAVWTENLGDHSGVSGSTAEALAQAAVASGTIEASVSEQDKLDIADRVWSTTMSGFNQDSTGDVLDRIHTATEITQATVTGVSATTTSFETNLTEITDDFWERSSFLFTAGNNIGQMRGIKFYTGATKEIEVETPLPFVPVDGDQFIITANRKFLAPEAYQNVIYYNEDNGIAGTEYPIGLYEYPVNNLTDALIIAADRNIDRISTRSDMTIEAGHDVSKMSIETHGIMGTDILFESGCSANNTTVKYANVSGEITNGDVLLLESCSIGNLENFSGIMNVATFGQGSEVSVENWANFISCHAGGDPGNEPELNIGTASVNINKYTGNLKLIGKIGTNRTVANFQSGNVIVGSTCVSGTIQILGIGAIERDDSGPNCKVDIDAAITKATIASAVWDESLSIHDNLGSPGAAFIGLTYGGKVCIDAITGVSGTTYPTGLPLQPVNNLADAKIIADINNIREFQLYSNLVISPGVSIDDYIFQAEQDINVVMMLQAGCTTQNSRFHHLILTGTFDGKSYIDHSTTLDISNYSGFIIDTIFMGDIGVVDPSVPSLFSLCGGGKTNSVVEIDLGDSSLNIGGWKSEAKLVNKTGTSSNIIELMSGEVTIDSTCVSGSIFVKGIGRLIADNSGPNCTVNTIELVNRYVIADEVWDELTVDHSDVGSYGEWASTIADNIVRTLGLTQENYYLDNTTYTEYSGAKLLTGGRLRIYSVAGSVGTSSNVISTYQITSVWTGDELDTYKVVKQ